jgi:capsule polysaccharide export protein KpsE/RkpR
MHEDTFKKSLLNESVISMKTERTDLRSVAKSILTERSKLNPEEKAKDNWNKIAKFNMIEFHREKDEKALKDREKRKEIKVELDKQIKTKRLEFEKEKL